MNRASRVALFLLVLLCLAASGYGPAGLPVLAADPVLNWGAVTLPVVSPGAEPGQCALSPDGILWMADAANGRLWRNRDNVTGLVGGTAPFGRLALSPGDGKVMALVTSDAGWRASLFLSADGGGTWTASGLVLSPGQFITDLAISPLYPVSGGQGRDIAVSTARVGAAAYGGVWLYQMRSGGFFAGWVEMAAANGLNQHDFYAVQFPPSYGSDYSLLAAAHSAATGNLELEIALRNPNTPGPAGLAWNPASSGFPKAISAAAADAVATASIALPADFSGQDLRAQRVWVAFDAGPGTGDVYLVSGSQPVRALRAGPRPYRLAFQGTGDRGRLVVGFAVASPTRDGTVDVLFSTNPQSAAPGWNAPLKGPSGGWGVAGEARAWVDFTPDGSRLMAGTFRTLPIANLGQWATPGSWAGAVNDESALCYSADGGNQWNQAEHINTTLSGLYDFVPAPDSTTAYLVSYNNAVVGPGYNGLESLWRSRSAGGSGGIGANWERVLSFATRTVGGAQSAGNQPILKVAPEAADGAVVFWGDQGGALIQGSADFGNTWANVNVMAGAVMADFGVADRNTVYILGTGGRLLKGTSTGVTWNWSAEINTQLNGAAYSLAVLGRTLLACGDVVSVSLDGGASWLPNQGAWPGLNTGGFVASIDPDAANNRYYYITQAGNAAAPAPGTAGPLVARARLGQSGYEEYTTFPAGADQVYPGIASPAAGVLYALRGQSIVGGSGPIVAPGALRALNALDSPVSLVQPDLLNIGLNGAETFRGAPNSLKTSSGPGGSTLWAVDGASGRLMAFRDTLAVPAPAISVNGQAVGSINLRISFSGYAQPVAVRWNLVAPEVGAWDVQVSGSASFSDLLVNVVSYVPPDKSQPVYLINTGPGPGQVPLMAGSTYYVRVRAAATDVGQVIRSNWSNAVSMTVPPGVPVVASSSGIQGLSPRAGAVIGAAAGVGFSWSPIPGTTEYSFVLATDYRLEQRLVTTKVTTAAYQYSGPLKNGRTYFWQVQALSPAPSAPSPAVSFSVQLPAQPAPPPAPVVISPPPVNVVPPPAIPEVIPDWAWLVIIIAGSIALVTLVLALGAFALLMSLRPRKATSAGTGDPGGNKPVP